MRYKDFKATVWQSKNTPEVAAMSAPSEARQRIEAQLVINKANLESKWASKTV